MDLIESARPSDLAAVAVLLTDSELPTAGVSDHVEQFLVARNGERIVGCIGIEIYDTVGLLRSLAVHEDMRGTGIGERLVHSLLDRAREHGLEAMYLLTTTADRYFPRFGFEVIARDKVDPRLNASEELRGACPDTAVSMRLKL